MIESVALTCSSSSLVQPLGVNCAVPVDEVAPKPFLPCDNTIAGISLLVKSTVELALIWISPLVSRAKYESGFELAKLGVTLYRNRLFQASCRVTPNVTHGRNPTRVAPPPGSVHAFVAGSRSASPLGVDFAGQGR